jgi:plasmid stability protein
MRRVPTLYVRDVPEQLYKRLRARARRNGRSLNAEVLDILDEVAEREQFSGRITQRLAELAQASSLPPDAPKPEDVIRELRDAPPRGI